MTGQERDYEAILRHVLHATTDQFEPVGDGLTKIRERLSEPWLLRQWRLLRSELMALCWFLVVRCESLFGKLRSRSGATDLAPDAAAAMESDDAPLRSLLSISTVVPGNREQKPANRAMAWFRPALAVAGAVVLVVAGVFALGSIRTVVGLDNATGTNTTNTGPGTGNGNANGTGSPLHRSGKASPGNSTAPSSSASAAHIQPVPSSTPCAAASPSSQGSPSPSPTSPSPTPSPSSASPSPTQSSPSPSPSTSTSQAPLTGPSPGQTQAIGTTALVKCAPALVQSPTNQASAGS